jgi:GNAT superfamily N-acetyltransferase
MTVRRALPDDVPAVLGLIRELADYERSAGEVVATEADLHHALFGPQPAANAHVVEHPGPAGPEVVGCAVWFRSFSTWTGRPGMYLEDLYVRPEHRGSGYGTALLSALARTCMQEGYPRLDWSVLDWNVDAVGFYRARGALAMDEWTVYRLTGPLLSALARDRPGTPRDHSGPNE